MRYCKKRIIEIGQAEVKTNYTAFLLAKGLTMKEAALKVRMSAKTIEGYWARLKRLTGCQTLSQFVWWAIRNKIVLLK